jgi:ribokinase
MKPSIIVVGSSNTDMVIKTEKLPAPGETILGGSFFMNAGGKGANQAVAAARLGGKVTFICKTGTDIFGNQAIRLFEKEGIDTRYIIADPEYPSGVALITVDNNGENCIAVASGANAALTAANVSKAEYLFEAPAIILAQLEIPINVIEYLASISESKKIKIVLNPAPACQLSDELLSRISIITPNKKEAEMLSGVSIVDLDSAKRAATILSAKGIETVIITLGPLGALVLHENTFTMIDADIVQAVDTTAAGDIFNAAFVVALSEGYKMIEAARFACRVATLSVTRFGAQASAPYRHEVTA